MTIRLTQLSDLPRLQEIFAIARRFMQETGNPTQWLEDYPSEELLHEDIAFGDSFVCLVDDRIVATFVLRGGEDPTYLKIYEGAWKNDKPYATIHRIASSGKMKGVFHAVMQFARQRYQNIRIDTHQDNQVMQRAILKEGFQYCGIIYCWPGEEGKRVAYQNTTIL